MKKSQNGTGVLLAYRFAPKKGRQMMDFVYEDPDMEDFLSGVAKRFCPSCGEPVIRNRVGRPKVYCSEKCSRDFWKSHQKPEEWNCYEQIVCPVCGRMFRAKKVRTRPRKYCSVECANRAHKKIKDAGQTGRSKQSGEENDKSKP